MYMVLIYIINNVSCLLPLVHLSDDHTEGTSCAYISGQLNTVADSIIEGSDTRKNRELST